MGFAPFTIPIYYLRKTSDANILVCKQSSSRLLTVLIEVHCPRMAHPGRRIQRGDSHPLPNLFLYVLWSRVLYQRQFCLMRKVQPSAFCGEGQSYFGL